MRQGARAIVAFGRSSMIGMHCFGWRIFKGELRLDGIGIAGHAALYLCLLFTAATSAWGQGTAAIANNSTSAFITFDAAGAGTGAMEGTVATSINAAGEVAGFYLVAGNVAHGYVRAADGTITEFDAPGAGTGKNQGTFPSSINTGGEIAGTFIDGSLVSHGFLRAASGTFTKFDAPGAGTAAQRGTAAVSVNDAGEITGFYTTGSDLTNSTYHGFLRAANGTFTTLDDPDAGSSEGVNSSKQGTSAYSINASGVIAGSYKDSNNVQHGFVRSASGVFTNFDVKGVGTCVAAHGQNFGGTSASSIDAAGTVAGFYTDTRCAQHGYVRAANGTITTFNTPGADTNPCATSGFGKLFCGTLGLSIDTAGAIAGTFVDDDGVLHGFLRAANGTFTQITAPGAATESNHGTAGLGINSAGAIVGTYADSNFVLHGFIYTPEMLVATTITLKSSLDSPVYGEPVTFTAKVSSSEGAPPNGEDVTFLSGKSALGTKALSGGEASLTTTALPVGTDSITAAYSGELNFAGSVSKALSETVDKAKSSTKLTSSKNPSVFGEAVTFTATVSGQFGGTATGTVTFFATNPLTALILKLGTATLSKGVARFTSSSDAIAGSITADYGGDAHFTASTSETVKQVVDKAKTTATLISSLNPSKAGQSVTFTVTVKGQYGGTPAGTATFSDGKTVLKTVPLSDGAAKFTTAALPAGTDSITAVYKGDANFDASTSNTLKQVVSADAAEE
jgi:hypothetical protein